MSAPLLSLLVMEQPERSLLGMTKAELHGAEAGVPTGLKAQRSVLQFKDVPEKPPVQAEAAHINIPGSARRREIPAKSLVQQRLTNISHESRVLSVEYHRRSLYLITSDAHIQQLWGTFLKEGGV